MYSLNIFLESNNLNSYTQVNGIIDESENTLLKNNSNNNLGGLLSLNSNDFSFLNPTVLNSSLLYNFPPTDKATASPNLMNGNNSFSNLNKEDVNNSKPSSTDTSLKTNLEGTGPTINNIIKTESNVENKGGKKRFMKAYEKVTESK